MTKRKGMTPKARPTEWTTAVAMLGLAAVLYSQDRNTAAFVATASACIPAIVTAVVEVVRKRAAAVLGE